MKYTLYDRLLRRELGEGKRYSKVRGIYGDRKWVDDLDIVNELGGHSGCVNALSWSRSGRLLASGSDDQHVNIHSYLPDSSSSQFSLATTILTGHVQNIFSVKFMPHSNDRTIVTAAGDAQVRVFDIEYSGHSTSGSSSRQDPIRSRRVGVGLNGFSDDVRVLSEGDTNAKVFRSHSDRVKRIVTESSPFFFLTCSEDGEVRQWDTRQPSAAYPAPREFLRRASASNASDAVPPPLISYKRYHLDLNTISCSPSQPHYIALGGAHLHCFLHDRRMLGRDRLAERGAKLSSPSNWDDHDDELMVQATQCVRKFAPNGQKRMRRIDNGHITACKISDANPNEMIVSWSGEWIYSFDLIRSPDATEDKPHAVSQLSNASGSSRARESKARKRKRPKSSSMLSNEGAERGSSRQRTESTQGSDPHDGMALMVQYENGQSEQIPIGAVRPRSPISEAREAVLPEAERQSYRIARATVKLRKHMFTLNEPKEASDSDPTGHATSFTSVLGFAASILPEMDDIARTWRYPVNPLEIDVALQNRLRENRAAARRFVQASGTLARVLGGKLRMGGNSDAITSRYFTSIQPAPNEKDTMPRNEQFGYDFIKAILLWLDSGIGALLDGFSSPSGRSSRFPIEKDASVDAVDDVLIPYLLQLASSDPVVNVDASRFEVDENRVTFASEKAAVIAFARALKIPFADLSSAANPASSNEEFNTAESQLHVQDRRTALKFWAFKVGRGVLMNAGKGINFAFVDRSFGGIGRADDSIRAEESSMRESQQDIDPTEEEDVVVNAELVSRLWAEESGEREFAEERGSAEHAEPTEVNGNANSADTEAQQTTAVSDDEDDSDRDVDPDEDDDDSDDDSDEEEGRGGRIIWRSSFERSKLRERVEMDVPCSSHTRLYRGHCNVKTVKDVNFFGLQDEYVVSGSDSGHIFIWDKKSSQLINILEGDGEVVNVVQPHPYEPMLAVSGIDHTIKIFSPDAQARHNARNGIGIRPADPSTFSSLGFGRARRRPNPSASTSEPAVPRKKAEEEDSEDEENEAKISPNGLSSRKRMHLEYQITSQNDLDRRGGSRDAFITRSMLAQLAQRIHDRGAGDDDGDGEGNGPILISDDCTVM
ncbi:WD40 repeat-like protein [Lepidopterella palustris CBS 459.81]|uniref:WD40 repeat-like protein n=1 Tax=Lepidopterella palustris CBS 459.81 TaxID=1314670 RepID=A0A8E2EKG3_9PEZI|nr:WD40 repeat-like protein [Lepidopterella palustris CBS 459.81]